MPFQAIRFYHFRNIEDGEVSLSAPEIFLVGQNGQGKSNFIEAIYALCFGASFRTRKDHELVRHGEDSLRLSATFTVDDSPVPNTTVFSMSGRKKEILVNDKVISDRKELIRNIPCVVFCHDDIEFVRGAPDLQRWFFNQTLSLFDPGFIDQLREYGRILKMRNAFLKSLVDDPSAQRNDLLEVYDEQLAAAGVVIQIRRKASVEAFNGIFGEMFRSISGMDLPLLIRYRPSLPGDALLESAIATFRERRQTDFRLATTTSGPHRDRFSFVAELPDGRRRDFTAYASTGQLRLLSLILRVSQARYYASQTGRSPILLLDDVLLELDREKRLRFLESLPAYAQAFYTFLPDERYTAYRKRDTLAYRVDKGTVHGIGS